MYAWRKHLDLKLKLKTTILFDVIEWKKYWINNTICLTILRSYVRFYVFMSVRCDDLETGFNKIPPNHTALLGTSKGSIFFSVCSLGLKGSAYQASKVVSDYCNS